MRRTSNGEAPRGLPIYRDSIPPAARKTETGKALAGGSAAESPAAEHQSSGIRDRPRIFPGQGTARL